MSVFSPRTNVPRIGGAAPSQKGQHDGEQHFALLYDRTRRATRPTQNIRSGWPKAGLFTFDPTRVLQDMRQPLIDPRLHDHSRPSTTAIRQVSSPLHTPSTAVNLNTLRVKVESQLERVDNDVSGISRNFPTQRRKLAPPPRSSWTRTGTRENRTVRSNVVKHNYNRIAPKTL